MSLSQFVKCLTPHGVSGLKFGIPGHIASFVSSHPAWGEWIEIDDSEAVAQLQKSLTPHGVSGLKLAVTMIGAGVTVSHPAWGEWIEIGLFYR